MGIQPFMIKSDKFSDKFSHIHWIPPIFVKPSIREPSQFSPHVLPIMDDDIEKNKKT